MTVISGGNVSEKQVTSKVMNFSHNLIFTLKKTVFVVVLNFIPET